MITCVTCKLEKDDSEFMRGSNPVLKNCVKCRANNNAKKQARKELIKVIVEPPVTEPVNIMGTSEIEHILAELDELKN